MDYYLNEKITNQLMYDSMINQQVIKAINK